VKLLRSPAIITSQFDAGEYDALVALLVEYGDNRVRAEQRTSCR
jgi:hypothetical protein